MMLKSEHSGKSAAPPLSPVSAADAVWTAARAVVDAAAYPVRPRAMAIYALKVALQDYDDLIAAMASHFDSSGKPIVRRTLMVDPGRTGETAEPQRPTTCPYCGSVGPGRRRHNITKALCPDPWHEHWDAPRIDRIEDK